MTHFEIKYRDQLYADVVNVCLHFNTVKPSFFMIWQLIYKKQTNKQNRIFTPILIDYFKNRRKFIA